MAVKKARKRGRGAQTRTSRGARGTRTARATRTRGGRKGTEQPTPPTGVKRNGFLALAVYDRAENGGNGDGKIGPGDAIRLSLRLWRDSNHNGVSERRELFRLHELGLRSIDLDYHESRRHDQHGNQFKYRSRVRDTNDAQLGRWAWDVYLIKAP